MKIKKLVLFFALAFTRVSAASCTNGQAEHLSKALSELDYAIELVTSIPNKDTEECVLKLLSAYKNELQMHYSSSEFEDLSEEGDLFFENIDEAITDCTDGELRLQIITTLKDMLEELKAAEKA